MMKLEEQKQIQADKFCLRNLCQNRSTLLIGCFLLVHAITFMAVTVVLIERVKLLEQTTAHWENAKGHERGPFSWQHEDWTQEQKASIRRLCRDEIREPLDTLMVMVKAMTSEGNTASGQSGRRRRGVTGVATSPDIIEQLADAEAGVLKKYCSKTNKVCVPGADGRKGVPGVAGIAGQAGPKGEPGDKGEKGDVGPPGTPGTPGLRGPKGNVGDPGFVGSKGEPGTDGAPGLKGQKGGVGDPGTKGDTGSKGEPGTKGAKGVAGKDGVKGQKGDAGDPTGALPGTRGRPPISGARGGNAVPFGLESSATCCNRLAKPTFKKASEEFLLAEGQQVTLTCDPEGYPAPTTAWFYSSLQQPNSTRALNRSGQDGLTISANGNSGYYRCQATNVLGHSSKVIRIRVIRRMTLSLTPKTLTVSEGSPVRLTCHATSEVPVNYAWFRMDEHGTSQEVTSGVTFDPTQGTVWAWPSVNVTDQGRYICQANNTAEVVKVTSDIIVNSLPYLSSWSGPVAVASSGDDVILWCNSTSTPTPIVTWEHNNPSGHIFQGKYGELHVVGVEQADQREFTCVLTNQLGRTSHSMQLVVTVKLTARLLPLFQPIGKPFVLECDVTGDTTFNVTWYKDDIRLDLNNSAKYIQVASTKLYFIHPISPDDVGVYTCEVDNRGQTVTSTSYAYMDIGTISCDATFSNYNCNPCGGECLGNCQGIVIGDTSGYREDSNICSSARHAGMLATGQSGTVVWQPGLAIKNFPSVLANGITSQNSSSNTAYPSMVLRGPVS